MHKPLTQPEILRLGDENLAEATRELARWLPPYEIDENEDLLLAAAGTRAPGPWNCGISLGERSADPERTLAAAQAFYARKGRACSIYARGHLDQALASACEQRGYTRLSNAPGMVLEQRVADPEPTAGVSVRELTSAQQAADLVDVVADAYQTIELPAAVTRKVFSQPQRWLRPPWYAFNVYEAEQPVASAMLNLSHGIAGIYWVGAVAAARGRGHATRVMRAISNHGFDLGARAIVLQASPYGEPVYKRLGYREFSRYPWYVLFTAGS